MVMIDEQRYDENGVWKKHIVEAEHVENMEVLGEMQKTPEIYLF